MMTKHIHYFKLIFGNLAVLCLFLGLLEIGLRLIGIGPYSSLREKPNVEVSPKGPYFEKDALLGYRHRPGKYRLAFDKDYDFVTTHDKRSLRATSHQLEKDQFQSEIWLMGCSFTHGWAISDEATFAWQLQQDLPHMNICNWGVNGYGTLHFYLQVKHALEQGKRPPAMIVLNHANFHFGRNVWSYHMRRLLTRWNHLGAFRQPYVAAMEKGRLQIYYASDAYEPWDWSSYSALVYCIQYRYEIYLDHSNKEQSKKWTMGILDQLLLLCRQYDIPLVLTNIAYEPDFIQNYSLDRGLPFVDLSIDIEDDTYTNAPYDGHPNKLAHRIYANRLLSFLKGAFPDICYPNQAQRKAPLSRY